MYDGEKKNKLEILVEDSPNFVAITGDHWTSAGNHSYLGVTGYFIDGEWNLNSFALTIMKTETRHSADKCSEQFLKLANDWGIENKISIIGTDSTANMLAARRAFPYEHIAYNAHILQTTITVCLDSSGFAVYKQSAARLLAISNKALRVPQNLTSKKLYLEKRASNLYKTYRPGGIRHSQWSHASYATERLSRLCWTNRTTTDWSCQPKLTGENCRGWRSCLNHAGKPK